MPRRLPRNGQDEDTEANRLGAHVAGEEFRLASASPVPPGYTRLYDPVSVLPHELAMMCLRQALPATRNYPARLLEFTSVCLKWQNILISDASLWTKIHYNWTAHDLLGTIALFLHLSRTMPLELVIWDPMGEEWKAVTDLLLPHTGRISRLKLEHICSDSNVINTEQIPLARNILESLGKPPSVVGLHFGRELQFDPLRLGTLDLPPYIRVISPIRVLLMDIPRRLLLTHITGREDNCVPFILSDRLRAQVPDLLPADDCSISALNATIFSLRQMLVLLADPSTSPDQIASSLSGIFIDRGGTLCSICNHSVLYGTESLEKTLGCIRGHFGVRPFPCPGGR